MNVVREINKINQAELDFGASGASWHDEYKDSAYIFVGGLHFDLTEGDVITIFSQYGEVMDINMPRDKDTGKRRGFAFLMYEDQRSTVLAVDNLNGAHVLEKTLRVDHVKNYKQGKVRNEDGELVEPEEQSLNAKPEMIMDDGDDAASESSASTGASIDPEDPMRDFLIAQRREAKALQKSKSKTKKSKSKGKHKDETPEERRARKAKKAEKKARKEKKGKSDGVRGVQDLLNSLGGGGFPRRERSLSRTPPRRERSRSPPPRRGYSPRRDRSPPYHDRDQHRSRELGSYKHTVHYPRETPFCQSLRSETLDFGRNVRLGCLTVIKYHVEETFLFCMGMQMTVQTKSGTGQGQYIRFNGYESR
ncbi:RRM domain-containing protein [Mycena indigotica]|uniref:RRM domain-containing protein n=1 Tax=Mycena indigotica TaxID=2126181 RepID=A0A8H6W595_9AGAR|nr:RRM domain-containing protein [Mycena indigotica]KAF7302268.1 RRM domain-containing protein [Mycena indigotica]